MTRQRITDMVTAVTRLPNTVNGGPRWRIALAGGRRVTTLKDSTAALIVSPEDVGRIASLTLDGRGQVEGYSIDDD